MSSDFVHRNVGSEYTRQEEEGYILGYLSGVLEPFPRELCSFPVYPSLHPSPQVIFLHQVVYEGSDLFTVPLAFHVGLCNDPTDAALTVLVVRQLNDLVTSNLLGDSLGSFDCRSSIWGSKASPLIHVVLVAAITLLVEVVAAIVLVGPSS